jgi:RimK family alpha-L-glutamate ligase
MHVSILSARTGWHTDELLRALGARGHSGCALPYEALVARIGSPDGADSLASQRQELLHADAVLARIIPNGSLEQIIYRVDALHWLEDRGVLVMNSPRTIERCVDKFYTSALLREAGLHTPETIICERVDDALAAVREMGDVIVKPIFGSMGHGMVRVSDPETAFRVFRALDMTRSVFYVQRVIDHAGCDIRAFVVGDRVAAAIERRATDGDWRTNISLGGEARAIELTPAQTGIALTAARAVGAEYAGVDILPARDGTMYALEVNGIPGWSGVQTATSVDIAGAIVDQLIARAKHA